MLALFDVHIDLETGDVLYTSSIFVVDHDGKLLRAASLDKVHARYWHTPNNEREFNMSPQRALWLTLDSQRAQVGQLAHVQRCLAAIPAASAAATAPSEVRRFLTRNTAHHACSRYR